MHFVTRVRHDQSPGLFVNIGSRRMLIAFS